MTIRRAAAPGLLLLAIVAYALPFVAMADDRRLLFTLSGAQLVTSETFYTAGVADPAYVPADPCLLSALVLAASGFFAGLSSRRQWLRRISLTAALGACVGLALFPLTTSARIPAAMQYAGSLHLAAGYWASLSCSVLAAALVSLGSLLLPRRQN